eukprot:tig00021464_g21724.t1
MKFAKQILYNAVPEWRTQYLNYSGAKKQLKRISKKMKENKQNAARARDLERGATERTPLLDQLPDEEVQFFKMLEDELTKINAFYTAKEREFNQRIKFFSSELFKPPTPVLGSANSARRTSMGAAPSAPTLSTSAPAPAFHPLKDQISELYHDLNELQKYCELNHSGFEKILKKHDKVSGRQTKNWFLPQVEDAYFHRSPAVREMSADLEDMYARLFEGNDREAARNALSEHLTQLMQWKRNTVWRDMLSRERKVQDVVAGDAGKARAMKLWAVALSFVLAGAIFAAPLLPGAPQAHRCLALLVLVSSLWALEAMPLYVTSIAVPVLVVLSGVLLGPGGEQLEVAVAAKTILARMMDPVVMLVLGGFTIASALSKHHLDKRLAHVVLDRAGTNPSTVMFTIMMLAVFLSMWISNVAAPVLCVSLIQPILSDLPRKSPYLKALLLGIAYACNIGGMVTPIASPQNAVALQALSAVGAPPITFLAWMVVAVPFAVILTVVCHFLLLAVYRPKLDEVPAIHHSEEKITGQGYFTLAVTFTTIGLWFMGPVVERVFGGVGVIAMIPVVLFFGTGVLPKEDFNNLPWNVVFLVGGGIALGTAVQSSHLLDIVTSQLQLLVRGLSPWLILVAFDSFVMVVTTFISHTAASLIVLPIVAQVGLKIGHPRLMVMSAAFMCSGAMGLPVSSFPNINSSQVEDDGGVPYLRVKDYVKTGIPFTVIVTALLVSVNYIHMLWLGW